MVNFPFLCREPWILPLYVYRCVYIYITTYIYICACLLEEPPKYVPNSLDGAAAETSRREASTYYILLQVGKNQHASPWPLDVPKPFKPADMGTCLMTCLSFRLLSWASEVDLDTSCSEPKAPHRKAQLPPTALPNQLLNRNDTKEEFKAILSFESRVQVVFRLCFTSASTFEAHDVRGLGS